MSDDDERAIAELLAGTGLAADDGAWKQAVLDAIDAIDASPPPRRSRWRELSVLVPVAAAAAFVLMIPGPIPRPTPEAETEEPMLDDIDVQRIGTAPGRRGDDLHPGDTVRVRVAATPDGVTELRVYRDARTLVLRCPGAPACEREREGDVLSAELRLDAPGTYRVLRLAGTRALPEPTGRLDDDAAAAAAAGATMSLGDPLEVR